MAGSNSREVRVIARPAGKLSTETFALAETVMPDPSPGEAQIRNLLMSVDPYMRPRLDNAHPLGVRLEGSGVGRVEKSSNKRLKEGDIVRHGAGFCELFNSDGHGVSALRPDPELPLTVYLHALGSTGMTAYGGLLEIARLKAGDQVFVSAAGGAVGSVAAQIAKLKGCYVVGSTGAADKRAWLLSEAGLDAVINYKAEPIAPALAAATPRGIDVNFENVGGAHLDAALAQMNPRGRVALCGMISGYDGQSEGARGLPLMIYARITMQGFVSTDFPHLAAAFASDMTQWLKDGRLRWQETVLEGIERAPEGLVGLFEGVNRGKMLIRLSL
jgi:hypothetical protein